MFVVDTRTPVKYAVNLEDVGGYPNSIIVRQEISTDIEWICFGDENGLFENLQVIYVHLIGNVPMRLAPTGDHFNLFICEVEYVGTHHLEDAGIVLDQYEVIDWHPIYPVKRDPLLLPESFFPDNYLSKYDIE